MKNLVLPFFLSVWLAVCISNFAFAQSPVESIKLTSNGKVVTGKLLLASSESLVVKLPEGWRYISGKVKIIRGDEVKIAQSIVGEKALIELDLNAFIKKNAIAGDYISFELSVRTKESGTLSTMKFPIE